MIPRGIAHGANATVTTSMLTIRAASHRSALAKEGMDKTTELLFVDDNSRDGSVEQVEMLKKEGYNIRIHVRTDERGLSSAVLKGFEMAQGDKMVCMDGDLQHPPEKVPEFLKVRRKACTCECSAHHQANNAHDSIARVGISAGDPVADSRLLVGDSTAQSLAKNEFVLGTRYGEGFAVDKDWPWYRVIISKGGRLLARPLTPLR